MNGDDSFSEPGGRVERSTRLAGVLLLIGAVLTLYLIELVLSRSPARVELFEGYGLAAGYIQEHLGGFLARPQCLFHLLVFGEIMGNYFDF